MSTQPSYRNAPLTPEGRKRLIERCRTRPYTPRHNGKVERHNRILAEEFVYARTWRSEQERAAELEVWNRHYNYHRPHGADDGKPPASATPRRVNNVLASYS